MAGPVSNWIDAERIYVNVDTLYREFAGDTSEADVFALCAGMGRLARSKFHTPRQQVLA